MKKIINFINIRMSPNIVKVIKSRRMRWAGHVARMEEVRGVYKVLVGRPKGRDHWEDLGVGGRITLSWTLVRWRSPGSKWFQLDQDRVQWRAFVTTVMNLQFP
jgi:hypothetical protein